MNTLQNMVLRGGVKVECWGQPGRPCGRLQEV